MRKNRKNMGKILDGPDFTTPTACDDDTGIIGIGSSASTNILASLGKKPP